MLQTVTIQIEELSRGLECIAEVDCRFTPGDPSVGYPNQWEVENTRIVELAIWSDDGTSCSHHKYAEIEQFLSAFAIRLLGSMVALYVANNEETIFEEAAELAQADKEAAAERQMEWRREQSI